MDLSILSIKSNMVSFSKRVLTLAIVIKVAAIIMKIEFKYSLGAFASRTRYAHSKKRYKKTLIKIHNWVSLNGL